jgi:hypothetical protein
MYSLYINNTGFERFCNFENSLRRSQNKEIFFSAFSVEGCGEEPIKNWKDISLFWVPSGARQRGAPNSNAYAEVRITTRSARGRLVQSLRDWSKKVRATVITSPQNDTSRFERGTERRAAGAAETQAGRKPRREATNWKGVAATQTEKTQRMLSLILSPKAK